MQTVDIPEWGKDSLGEAIDHANWNTKATFANLRPIWNHLSAAFDLFEKVSENLGHTDKWFVLPFVARAASCYVAAVRLSTSGQLPESYAVQRACLENALYALHLCKDTQRQRLWLDRHVSDEAKRRMITEFAVGKTFKSLESDDAETARVAKRLYELTIDYGAHPNPWSVLTQWRQEQEGEQVTVGQTWLTGDCPPMRLCLKTTAATGIASLHVFQNIWPERFSILGMREKLHDLRDKKSFKVYMRDIEDLPGWPTKL